MHTKEKNCFEPYKKTKKLTGPTARTVWSLNDIVKEQEDNAENIIGQGLYYTNSNYYILQHKNTPPTPHSAGQVIVIIWKSAAADYLAMPQTKY